MGLREANRESRKLAPFRKMAVNMRVSHISTIPERNKNDHPIAGLGWHSIMICISVGINSGGMSESFTKYFALRKFCTGKGGIK